MERNQLGENAVKTIGVRLFAPEIAGKQFDDYIKDLWSCLMDGNNVFRIGIHGIGGVGKTQVAKCINNKLLQCPNKFGHVFWVSMSPDWSSWNRDTSSPIYRVHDLQTSISKAVGVDLSDGDDESKRAAQMIKGLTEKKNFVLILDDVWDYIPLEEIGIPVECTVLFTTRSLGVCRRLGCEKKIEIKCLPSDESYELFKKKLGKETTLSKEVEEMSRLVADKCGGLPFAITIMAREMKGITDKRKWRNALTRGGEMYKKADMEIFRKLKTSYDYLKDTKLQHCFLLCAPLVEHERRRMELVEHLVDEGIIKNKNSSSRREELDEALTMLDFLRDAGLLEIMGWNFVGMNKLIRSMALQIMEESHPRVMVNKNIDLLDEESWTEDLVRVTLDCSKIENIPCNYSPNCPNLSTLVLSGNRKLGHIGDSFFEGMPRLKVLHLSDLRIASLPSSVSGLVNLTTLVLSWCSWLKNIPSLAKLKELKKLDLSFSGVEKVPGDIGELSKLTYLDLYETLVKELNSEILAKLSHLQFLRLPCLSPVKGEIVAGLGRLETLKCSFDNTVELNNYLIHLKEREPPLQLRVQLGRRSISFANETLYYGNNPLAELDDKMSGVGLDDCDINETTHVLMNYFQDIVIRRCIGARSLCKFSPIKGPTQLKHFSLQNCDGLEFLSVTGQGVLESIEYLELFLLEKLSLLVRRKEGDVGYGSSCFSNLRMLFIQGCPSIKRLFPTNLVPNLKNLQRLYVLECPLMEEIFGEEEEEESKIVEKKICCLPKLCILWLVNLPKLKRLCGGGLICNVSNCCSIKVDKCPNISK